MFALQSFDSGTRISHLWPAWQLGEQLAGDAKDTTRASEEQGRWLSGTDE
jgi:hypothetical protein